MNQQENAPAGQGEGQIETNRKEMFQMKTNTRSQLEAWCAEVRRRLDEANEVYENVEMPTFPLEAPSWASDSEIAFGISREVEVTYSGHPHRSGDVAAWINQVWIIELDTDHGHDGPADPPMIVHSASDDELSWERAFQLAAVLRSAARELRRQDLADLFGFDPKLSEEENLRLEEQADLSDELGEVMRREPSRVWWGGANAVSEE